MREILFRGKRIDNSEWVYGYLSKTRNIEKLPAYLKLCIDYEEKGVMCSSIIIPETVGQYTGLKDKNGVKIFEGDILHDVESSYDYQMKWFDDYGCFGLVNRYGSMDIEYSDIFIEDMFVIGNIHDNPEILEEKHETNII